MPQVQPPPPKPIESDIALFAKAYFNIELTSEQLGVIKFFANGLPKGKSTLTIHNTPQNKASIEVLRLYMLEGLKPGGRVRLPKHPLPPVDKTKLKGLTQEGKILAMIKRPGGAYNFELSRFALKYTSVISELRKDGYDIVADRQYLKNGRASNTWRYRLAGQ